MVLQGGEVRLRKFFGVPDGSAGGGRGLVMEGFLLYSNKSKLNFFSVL